MARKKDPFDIKLTNNLSAKDNYFKNTFEKTSPGKPMVLKPGMKINPKYHSGGGKISKYYSAGGTVITGRD